MRTVLLALVIGLVAGTAAAQEATAAGPAAQPASTNWAVPISQLGACLAAGVIVIGGSFGIGRIAAKAVESIARQPEAAGQLFLAWLLPAAMIEGVTLFGIVLCLLVITRA